ncbi:MAG TPA: prepilin-type N-terminal cleavage/methylation domain-containing protein [Longimicrobiales bacterium]
MNRRAPSGFTLVELLIAVVVTAAMLAAVFQTVVVQQRSYREQMAILDTRQTARTALELIATEIREVSATGGDIYAASADSIRFRAFGKLAVVCDVANGGLLEVWELGEKFTKGDSVMIFSDGGDPTAAGDVWVATTVMDRGPPQICTDTDWPEHAKGGVKPTNLPAGVGMGSLLRGFVAVTYGSYAIDGEQVVGRRGKDGRVTALVGPILEHGGLEFRYYDANGAPIAYADLALASRRADIRRVEIVVRAPREAVGGTQAQVDSLVTQVRLRGNT